MSSLRNAVKRITHKERSQPRSRSHLGFLEKKKDYRVRAKDYHRKEDKINAMKEKASMRNPDEFYFGMHNSQVTDGRHRKTELAQQKAFEAQVGIDTVRIMKDQDLTYVRLQKQQDVKKMEKLRASLHFLEDGPMSKKRKHTVFVESQEELEHFDAVKHFDTVPELVDRAFNRPKLSSLQISTGRSTLAVGTDKDSKQARKDARKIAKARSAAYGALEARTKRVAAMELAESHLLTEKLASSKGRKRLIKPAQDGKPAQYKWRRKRLS